MQSHSFAIRRPVFFLLNGALLLLCALVFCLYRDKKVMQRQNRELIIQNESLLSVNIILGDSVKQKAVPAHDQNPSFTNEEKEK